MSYCPKCGNKVDETMTFCPRCGASLKFEAPSQAAPAPAPAPMRGEKGEKNEKNEKQEKHEQPEKGEKQEKGEYGFIGWLIGGLILIIIGFFSLLRIGGYLTSGMDVAIVFLVIGVVVIITAVYLSSRARKRYPPAA